MRLLSRLVAADAMAADLRRSGALLRAVFGALRRRPEPDESLAAIDDPAERFSVAAARFGRSEADLEQMLRALYRRFSIFYTGVSLLIAAAIVTGTWASMAGVLPLWALAMESAFRHFQIRTRRLDSLVTWLKQPGEWLPLGDTPRRPMMMILFLLLAAAPACAATTSTAQDVANGIVQSLLPMSGGRILATTLSTAISVMTSTLMFAGALLLAYHTVVATVVTAESGKVFGERYSLIFTPIRYCLGFACLVSFGGFSGVHLLIYLLAVGSNDLGNKTWTAYVASVLTPVSTATTAPGIPPTVGGSVLAEELLRNEICARITIINAGLGQGVWTPVTIPAPGGVTVTNGSNQVQVWNYGDPCGGISLPIPPAGAPAPVAQFSAARIAAVAALLTAVQSGIGQQAAEWATLTNGPVDFPTGIQAKLDAAGAVYDKAMLSAASDLAAQQNSDVRTRLINASAAGGWMQAFGYDRALSQASAQTTEIASQAPAWSGPKDLSSSDGSDSSGYGAALQKLGEELQAERGAGALTASDLAAAGQNDDGYITRLLEPLDHRISQAILDWSAADPTDPVADMMSLGSKLSAAAHAVTTASVALAFPAGNAAAKLIGADLAFKTALDHVRPVVWLTFVAGWTLQFLCPMLVWVGGFWLAVTWVIGLVELIIVGPIWALLLIRLDGQELIDNVQKPFVVVLANWALKPTLGILGFMAYRTILTPCFQLLSSGFATSYVGSQGGHMVGVVGVVGGVLFLSFLNWQLMMRLSGLVGEMADRVPRLLGLGDGGGLQGGQEHSRTVGGFVAAGRTSAPGGGGGSGSGSRGGPRKSGGGGGAPGVRPAAPVGAGSIHMPTESGGGGDVGNGGASGASGDYGGGGWVSQTGGYYSLSEEMRASAEQSYANITSGEGGKAEWARDVGLEGYVDHVQQKEQERRGGGD